MRRSPATILAPRPARRRLSRPWPAVALAAAAAAAAAGLAARATGAPVAGCAASALSVKMTVTPGSGAAGHIGYTLAVRNRGYAACRTGNHPKLKLLKAGGQGLATHVVKVGATKTITVAAGHTVRSSLFFSPDVPGVGEPQTGPCEPVAHKVRVTFTAPASGSRVGAVSPPTSVCEQGSIQEKPLV
jgi:hypothetical protein